jgi:hypothetical protein
VSPLTKATTAARVRIPADVEREDRLLGNLTARQLAILACGGVVLWALYSVTAHVVALPVFAALAAPLAALVVAMALGRVGGVSADRVALAAWRHHRSPHRLVPAPDGVPVPSASFAGLSGPATASWISKAAPWQSCVEPRRSRSPCARRPNKKGWWTRSAGISTR